MHVYVETACVYKYLLNLQTDMLQAIRLPEDTTEARRWADFIAWTCEYDPERTFFDESASFPLDCWLLVRLPSGVFLGVPLIGVFLGVPSIGAMFSPFSTLVARFLDAMCVV